MSGQTKRLWSVGEIIMAADDIGLIGLWFENQKYYADSLKGESVN